MSNKYFNPWLYPPIPGAWEVRNNYEIIVHLVNGNSYHVMLILGKIAIMPVNSTPIPSYQETEERDVVRDKCEELWGDRVGVY